MAPVATPGTAHRIPVEILSEIFLLALEHNFSFIVNVMLVCRRWRDILLLTPGILRVLRIGASTKKEVVQEAIRGEKWLLDVYIDTDSETVGGFFNADSFHACFMAAAEVAPRWRSLWIDSFPLSEGHKAVQIVQRLERLEFFRLSKGRSLGNCIQPLMTAITTTATPYLTQMELCDSNAITYLAQPTCFHILHSLESLTLASFTRMDAPVDILPHLQRLNHLTAHQLQFPIYPPGASLPLIQTLKTLNLKSVSVQWMAGRVFPALERCIIKSPHHIDTITLEPTIMPSCTSLEYYFNDLRPLGYFHHPPLTSLTVECGQWSVWRGNLQLVALSPKFTAQSLTHLHLYIQCSEWLLVEVLKLAPALEELLLGLASPRALSEDFFLGFVATESNAGSPCEVSGSPSQTRLPLCTSLQKLLLKFRRWFRGSEKAVLIPVLGDIVSSHQQKNSFQLDLIPHGDAGWWYVGSPVERIYEDRGSVIGILSPHGITHVVPRQPDSLMRLPFKEAEYLLARTPLSIDCLMTLHHLVELRTGDAQGILPTTPPHDLTLFHTLRVLDAGNIDPLFLTNQTLHKLERCRLYCYEEDLDLSQGQHTQMPVCTRLVVNHLTLLATIKLPRICELGVSLDHPYSNMIWGMRIAMNANLSGLALLHVHDQHQRADLIGILKSLPGLRYLILGNGEDLDVKFFRALVPMGANGTSVMRRPTSEGWISAILCPMLEHLCIEGMDLTEQSELIPVLNEVVTLRSMCGSPLKRFTFAQFRSTPGSEFTLIGRDGSFAMEKVILSMGARPFKLDI